MQKIDCRRTDLWSSGPLAVAPQADSRCAWTRSTAARFDLTRTAVLLHSWMASGMTGGG